LSEEFSKHPPHLIGKPLKRFVATRLVEIEQVQQRRACRRREVHPMKAEAADRAFSDDKWSWQVEYCARVRAAERS
jgi:hypothetical protein